MLQVLTTIIWGFKKLVKLNFERNFYGGKNVVKKEKIGKKYSIFKAKMIAF